jgi:UV DNA damage endonuclease
MRLGLCCGFVGEPIHFRTTTARFAGTLAPKRRPAFLLQIARDNAATLARAVEWCAAHGVGAFRVTSELLPLYTHPRFGYDLDALDPSGALQQALAAVALVARRAALRLSFHPDQFVVIGSSRPEVVTASLAELEYQATVAALIGAEQLTIHGGGAVGGKPAALDRLARGLDRLSDVARTRIALENDDRVYTVEDLLPLCRRARVPLVYDVHHHRCNPDALDAATALDAAAATWGRREPWAHLSSPLGGWRAPNPRLHADFITPRDLPRSWIGRRLTVDVEAKAKERAVLRLQRWLDRQGSLRA